MRACGIRRWVVAVLVSALPALAVLTPGRASAYFTGMDSAKNRTTIGGNRIEIVEEYTPPEKVTPGSAFAKAVRVENVGNSSCYVRIRAVFSDSDAGQYCSLDWNTTDFYYCAEDGYYYCKGILAPQAMTPYLFTTVTVSPDAPEEALAQFSILVYAESCQAGGFGQYEEAWQYFGRNRP